VSDGDSTTILIMNARPAIHKPAEGRSKLPSPASGRGVGGEGPAHPLSRALLRLPLAAQVLPIAGAFLCSCLLYGRIAGERVELGWGFFAGLASFFVLFVQLRFIDDLDDLERDHPAGECTAASRSALRARLLASLAACLGLIVALNFGKWHALAAAAAATLIAYSAPFVLKRLLARSLALCSLAFEGAPFAIFAYCYYFWRDAGGRELPVAAIACVVILFWIGYEVWKFSRKVHTAAMQPYFLSLRGVRAALNALLIVAMTAGLTLACLAGLSGIFTLYAVVLPLVWLAWINTSWASAHGYVGRPLWAGLTFVGALELGLLMELLNMPGTK